MKLFLSGVVNSLGSGFPVCSPRLSEAPEKPQTLQAFATMGSVLGFEEFCLFACLLSVWGLDCIFLKNIALSDNKQDLMIMTEIGPSSDFTGKDSTPK